MIRSLFFAPANRPDLLAKFPRFGADCCVIDLEDGTPVAEKLSARRGLAQAIDGLRNASLKGMLAVRVNVPGTEFHDDDVRAVLECNADAIVIPKLERMEQLQHLVDLIQSQDKAGKQPKVIAGIESVRGVMAAPQLCAFGDPLVGVFFGAEDFAADIGGRRTRGGQEVMTARSLVIMAASAADIFAIDQAVVDIRDDALFMQDAASGQDLGYVGKTCLTPGQVKLANTAFTPSAEEVGTARRLIDAYEAAIRSGVGTIDFEGKMIDIPLLARAKATLAKANATDGSSAR